MVFLIAGILLSPQSTIDRIVLGAQRQLSWNTAYTPGYFKIGFPNGDIPKERGVCTDVIVRALRYAGYDLQVLINQDMKSNWSKYPRYSGQKKPDSSIDHRRVPNQVAFFKRYGTLLPLNRIEPGDIIYWKLSNGLDHTGIVSNRKAANGRYMVIHNIAGIAEEDCLYRYRWVLRFRYPK